MKLSHLSFNYHLNHMVCDLSHATLSEFVFFIQKDNKSFFTSAS